MIIKSEAVMKGVTGLIRIMAIILIGYSIHVGLRRTTGLFLDPDLLMIMIAIADIGNRMAWKD